MYKGRQIAGAGGGAAQGRAGQGRAGQPGHPTESKRCPKGKKKEKKQTVFGKQKFSLFWHLAEGSCWETIESFPRAFPKNSSIFPRDTCARGRGHDRYKFFLPLSHIRVLCRCCGQRQRATETERDRE